MFNKSLETYWKHHVILLFACLVAVAANQRLDGRIKHVPTKINNFIGCPTDNLRNTFGSSIAEHFMNNHDSAEKLSVDFSLY